MQQHLKTHAVGIAIGLFSVLAAYWIEPFIPQVMLYFLVLVTLTSLGITFWLYLTSPVIGMMCSIMTTYFHFYCGSCFIRQVALAFIIAGCAITLWHGISHRKSENKLK